VKKALAKPEPSTHGTNPRLISYRLGVIDLYAEIPNRASDLGVSK
jgi:hypothetical protein